MVGKKQITTVNNCGLSSKTEHSRFQWRMKNHTCYILMKTTRCPIRSEKKIGPVTSHISANNRLVKSLSHFFFFTWLSYQEVVWTGLQSEATRLQSQRLWFEFRFRICQLETGGCFKGALRTISSRVCGNQILDGKLAHFVQCVATKTVFSKPSGLCAWTYPL